jgi:sugar lactone lactonase YvrE
MKEKKLIGRNKCESGCEPKYLKDIIRLNELNFDYVNLVSQTDKLNQLDMKCVRFEQDSLLNGTFTNINFNGASFDGSRLNGAKFSGCSFIAATFYGTELNDVDFGDSNLEGAQCINVHLSTLKFILAPPLRASSIDIPPNAKWKQNGITVAGGNGNGSGSNQLYFPQGLYVDDDQTIYIADRTNHRIMEWKCGAKSGRVVVGGNGQGNGTNQLNETYDVIVDRERDSLIICDYKNRRVVRWPRRDGGGTSGETIISNITCWGLRMDENGFLYVVDTGKHEVRRYNMSESEGKVVAGGNRSENGHDKLSSPHYVFVDRDHSVYVSDLGNHRVMKWEENATKGIVVAGGNGIGNESNLTQLHFPQGVVVDQLGTVYVADTNSQRIMRWAKGSSEGSVIAGGNGWGEQSNQLKFPHGLSFDRHGNLYVADHANHRVQKFEIEQTRNE